MADAFIYYRLEGNGTDVNATYPAPTTIGNRNTLVTNLIANFPAQILMFTIPEELIQNIGMTYENNIKDAPVSNPDGTRRINKQDNGINFIRWTYRGRFRESATDLKTLVNMAVRLQVEASTATNSSQFGIFGFYTDNTTLKPFNIDPTNSIGLTIKGFGLNRDGMAPKVFDFDVTMTFGGTYVGLP